MKSINQIIFSPTKTTKNIISYIALGFEAEENYITDITIDKGKYTFPDSELAIVGVPVYSGRIPTIIRTRLTELQGNNRPVVPVVVYGNRAYDDALLELSDLLTEKGFRVISAAAFIGEHSFSSNELPIAIERPDCSDINHAYEFGKKIRKRAHINTSVSVPGNFPYKAFSPKNTVAPVTDSNRCTLCLSCVDVCPINAIECNNPTVTNADLCIKCSACIKVCERGRVFLDPSIVAITEKLHNSCIERKEPELFINS